MGSPFNDIMRVTNELIEDLSSARNQLETIFDSSTDLVAFFTPDGLLIHVNATFCRVFGQPLEEIRHSRFVQYLGTDTWQILDSRIDRFDESGEVAFCQSLLQLPDRQVNFHWYVDNYLDESAYGRILKASGRDMTVFETAKSRVDQIYSMLPLGILTIDERGKIESQYSDFTEVLLGGESLAGKPLFSTMRQQAYFENDPALEEIADNLTILGSRARKSPRQPWVDIRIQDTKMRDPRWVRLNFSAISVGDYVGRMFITVQDVSDLILKEHENLSLKHQTLTDPLTGIANRRAFDQALTAAWRSLSRTQDFLGLLMIDVDYFKSYNDTYGHTAGDECLRAVANSVAGGSARARENVFRYGGEEFAAIIMDKSTEAIEDYAEHLRTIVENLAIKHENRDDDLKFVTISIGLFVLPGGSKPKIDTAQLMLKADEALYSAKQQGRNQVVALGK